MLDTHRSRDKTLETCIDLIIESCNTSGLSGNQTEDILFTWDARLGTTTQHWHDYVSLKSSMLLIKLKPKV